MLDKIYKFKFEKREKVLLIIFFALFFSTILLATFRLLGLFGMKSYYLFFDVSGIIFSLIICLLITFTLLVSKYVLNDVALIEKVAFFTTKIPYEKISNLVFDKNKNALFLFYDKKGKQSFLRLNIEKSIMDDFIENLKAKNDKILYEIYTGE